MLWFGAILVSTLWSNRPGGLLLRFTCHNLVIESAEVMILRSESFRSPGDRVVFSDGQTLPLPSADLSTMHLDLRNDRIEHVPISRPGTFTALLMGLQVRSSVDRRCFEIKQFNVEEFTVTEADLRNGSAEVQIASPGVFRVTVLDKTGRPVPDRVVSFSKASPATRGQIRLVQVRATSSGEIFMLGRPEDFYISAPGPGEPVVLRVDPL